MSSRSTHRRSQSVFRIAIPFFRILTCCWLLVLAFQASATANDKPPVYGRIVDDLGKPVTNAEVAIQGPRYFQTFTDEQGRYEFAEVPERGEYRLSVKSKAWVGITDYQELPRLLVDPDEPLEKNLTLGRACQIEVRVVDPNNEPIRSVSLYYALLGDERSGNTNASQTDREGLATVGGLAPSQTKYIIATSIPSRAPAQLVFSATDPDNIQKATITLESGQTIRGKAICSDGEPASGWRIHAIPDWWNFGIYSQGAVIAEDGSFELRHIGGGDHNVSISIPMGDRMFSSRVVLTQADLTQMKLPIEVKVDYPSPGSMSYLTGKIRWIGKPLNENIEISGYSYESRHHISGSIRAGETEFKIGPAPPGVYRIRPEHPELEVINLRKIKNLSDLDHVRIPNDKPLQVVLRVRGQPQVRGSVIDEETKEPIQRFRYRVTKLRTLSGPNYVEHDHWTEAKDDQGQFEHDVHGPGIYQVSVLADGYAINSSEPINTNEESDKSVVIALGRGVAVRGTVVDAEGQPVDGAMVRALSMASGSMTRVMNRFVNDQDAVITDNGEFVFEHLREGYDTFRVTHPDYVFADAAGIKVSEQTEPLQITLTVGATIEGRVFNHLGLPEPNVTLLFQDDYAYGGGGDEWAGRFGKVTTDAEGKYAIEHIPALPCYVSQAEGWNTFGVVRQALLPVDGQVHELNLGGTSRLTGQLIINDAPAVDARLQIGGADSMFGAMQMFARSDQEGRFTFCGAPAGHWTLYREIDRQRSEWVKIRELDVPPEDDLDLGVIKRKVGRLTVECRAKSGTLPDRVHLDLQAYNDESLFGRSAARAVPRELADAPVVFDDVSPGDYELVCDGTGDFQLRQRLQITEAEIDSTIPFEIPVGTATVTADIRTASGESLPHPSCTIWGDEGRIIASFKAKPNDGDALLHESPKLPAGNYKIRQGNFRDAAVIGAFQLVENEDQRIEITMADESTTPNSGAEVTVTDEFGVVVPCRMGISGEGGQQIEQRQRTISTTLSGPPGKYTLRIDQPGFEPQEHAIELKPNTDVDEKSELRVRLRRLKH